MPELVTQLQIVWFSTESGSLDARALSLALTGHESDSDQTNRVPSQALPFFSRATTDLGGVQVTLQVGLGRVDLTITPSVSSFAASDAIPTFLLDPEILDLVEGISKASNESIDQVARIGLHLSIVDPQDDLECATIIFGERAGVGDRARNMLDLVLQSNCRGKIGTTSVNRISRMSVDNYQLLAVSQANFGAMHDAHPVTDKWAVSTFYDFNTVPKVGAFQGSEVSEILGSLVEGVINARVSGRFWGEAKL